MSGTSVSKGKRVLFGVLAEKNISHKIAYIAILAAFNVVVNAFSVPLGITQFSLTIFASALSGILIGPLFGFAACFIGDTLGYIIGNGGGNGWTPWIGISMGAIALIAGFVMNGFRGSFKGAWAVKLSVVCLLSFVVATLAMNTTILYLLWYKKSFDGYWSFAFYRFFVLGQIWNSLLNYALLFIFIPVLNRIKPLKINVK